MTALLNIIKLQFAHDRMRFISGFLIALIPVVAGLALLGVAGWFITAAAVAGLTGVFLNIFVPSALIRGLAIARTAGRYGERLLTHDATFRFLANLRVQVFKGAAAEALLGRKLTRSAVVMNRLTSDVTALDAIYLRLVVPIVVAILTAVLAAVALGALTILALLPLGGFLVIVVALCRVPAGRRDRNTARRQEAAVDAIRVRTVDLVAGRRDLSIYGGMEAASGSVETASDRLKDVEAQQGNRSGQLSAYAFLAGQLLFAALLVMLGQLALSGELTLAYVIGGLLFALALPEVFAAVLPGALSLARTRLASNRIFKGVTEASRFDQHFSDQVSVQADKAGSDQALVFENVVYRYPAAEEPVLTDLSFSVAASEVVALTGRSGCGKSTVSSLASGLLLPASGTIRLLGLPLQDWSEADLRAHVTVLSQRPYLFHGTIAKNLRIANPAASDEELWEALEAAALSDRGKESAQGLQAIIGEGGLGFSGGEQRRLGLARAYLTTPKLWVLDELTEGLDPDTAEDVLARFFAFKGEAAVLMIAHKASEIARADRVLALTEGGQIIQS
ncbi:ABC transporter, CydDC-E family, permease/ATP-binding protein CydC [Roseibium sp. TrichSKD4]|uniref:thiol reductant ABC exporter subunit CydC n=1 Tax=Roseibium sp. TrichSKD4 TaxID=744980 RepID=UPI0001E570C2|nr:thiol reductant ABC exporter subunit CydC [Roseibium sp. TrichSKD4]EFO30485.1 ABC transporter, CydDC-E family, permease/ATP-binding protein CydC [Roseibium sp. TrichSKD4]